MSINLPPLIKTKRHSRLLKSLNTAAEALWLTLLDTPVSLDTLTRVAIDTAELPSFWQIMSLFDTNPIQGRFYWANRQASVEILGLGIADEIRDQTQTSLSRHWQTMNLSLAGTDASYLGGLSFSGKPGTGPWQDFDSVRFCLPLIEFKKTSTGTQICAQIFAKTSEQWHQQFLAIRNLLTKLVHTENLPATQIPALGKSIHLTQREEWKKQVNNVLAAINKNDIEKVVLARATQYNFTDQVSPASLAHRWQQQSQQTYGFLFNFSESSFIGFSPERLLRQNGQEIATEALAGTQPRGQTRDIDLKLEMFLRQDEKLIHEHNLVSKFIHDRLHQYSDNIIKDADVSILKLSNVQHRQASFRGHLSTPDITADLLLSLLPTPAVSGYPQSDAMTYIERTEQTTRGWYSGAVGIVGAHSSEFSVAIRSALLNKDRLVSYAGAGIVHGSKPELEWLELNDKSSIVRRILE